jgi:outer membrane lipoprotein SlyB
MLFALTLLGACASGPQYAGGGGYDQGYGQGYCRDCGTVERIVQISGDRRASGGGAIAGAVIGGVLGSQVGSGSGRDAATVAGAIAGGVAGHNIEKNTNAAPRYEITVRMNNGRRLLYTQRDHHGLREGDVVISRGNSVVPYR